MIIKKIIADTLANDRFEEVHAITEKGFFPIRMEDKVCLFSIAKRSISTPLMSQATLKYELFNLGLELFDRTSLDLIFGSAVKVARVTHNPFLPSGLYYEDEEFTEEGYSYNEVRYSKYYTLLESIEGKEEVSLLLKSIRKNDETNINGLSLFEIIVSHQYFSNKKIMAIPCNYSEDRGVGKTTLLSIGSFLYNSKSYVNPVSLINAGNKGSMQWENNLFEKRVAIYDDIPNNRDIVEPLGFDLKSKATSLSDMEVNIKGSGLKRTNPCNYSLTTNSIYAIPLDSNKDRRIYPIETKKDDWSVEEQEQIKKLNIPLFGDNEYHSIAQDILNHLKWVYDATKDNEEIKYMLNKEVPISKFSIKVASRSSSYIHRFKSIIDTAETANEMIEALAVEYAVEPNEFEFLVDSITKSKGQYGIVLNKNNVILIGQIILETSNNVDLTFKYIKHKLFATYENKQFKVKGKNFRGVRLECSNLKTPYLIINE